MAKTKLDKDLVRELADLLEETGLSEIEIEQGTLRIRVARPAAGSPAIPPQPIPVAAVLPPTAPASAGGGDVPAGAVVSPMVGTAYRASEPGAAPFIEIGTQVTKGQTCMIVEAMKTMNPIAAPKAGTVTAVLVDDSQPVEYGEPLFVIE